MKRQHESTKKPKHHLVKRYKDLGVIAQFMPTRSKYHYDDIKVGTFNGALLIEWHGPRRFVFFQDNKHDNHFSFTRHNGEVITPNRMPTDAGSIPKILWTLPGFSPWEFGPAYIIHDWEFRAHTCENSSKTFEEVNKTLLEGIKTLMESSFCEKNISAYRLIDYSIHSSAARKHWEHLMCSAIPETRTF